jgi:hypothetical protein
MLSTEAAWLGAHDLHRGIEAGRSCESLYGASGE